MPLSKILVVDDFEPFRRFVCSMLEQREEFQVIGQASDGLEACQKATDLRPDLILLDIGLPKLNGIETARRLHKLVPGVRILFFSQYNSSDVVQEALGTGALGYVHKPRAHSELLPAIEAVLRGRHFVSSNLMYPELYQNTTAPTPHRREIILCPDDAAFLDAFADVIAAALATGNAAIVLATESHREALLQRLKEQGLDVGHAIKAATYIPLDVAEALSAIMVSGLPDPARFFEGISGFIEAAAKGAKANQPRVVVCGEGIAFLRADGKVAAATRLEQLCDELAAKHKVDVFCACPLDCFHDVRQ
jgi:DNA-binding NarL/FixJ family response regulator